ncbi:6-phosphogluconolactonase [Papilio machaon]|uniref:6-phosphogluconolactonase n=1 Tax=Papilio machaon TaxID=76193 RepID=A0A0N1INN4_PAPMA|nr:6-phosphogluconolactonase [Papilio machaon]KPJ10244.1 6-phosphogluconolactonase [Papilio machaon]
MTTIKVKNEQEIIKKLSSYVEKISNDAIVNRGRFYIGLSGGSVIKYLCEGLPQVKTDWSKWTLAFCDERVVPEDSDDSTFGCYERMLIPKTKLSRNQFIILKQGVTAEEAAKDYTEQLKEAFKSDNFKFDLLLLGMGPDGHTCSLFPGHPLLDEVDLKVAAITDSPKPPPARITLTYPVINNARNCIFACSGAGKAEMLKRILKDKEDLPAARVQPKEGSVYWLVDESAAQNL